MKSLRYLAAALVALVAAFVFYSPLQLSALVLLGRASVCPLSRAIASPRELRTQIQTKDRILKASRMVEQDPAGFNAWRTPQGRFWLPKGSDYVLAWDLAEQERNIYGNGPHFVHPGDTVLDCGANVGVFVRKALAAGAGLVVAIELAPENIECLRRNFTDEIGSGHVIVYPKGVWDKDDFLTLAVDPENSAADTVVMHPEKASQGPTVPLTTIDKLVSELQLQRVDFIKMDIEGAEKQALAGGRATIARFHPRMALSAYHRPEDPQRLPQLVRETWSGYRMECGPCADAGQFIRPDILYFY